MMKMIQMKNEAEFDYLGKREILFGCIRSCQNLKLKSQRHLHFYLYTLRSECLLRSKVLNAGPMYLTSCDGMLFVFHLEIYILE